MGITKIEWADETWNPITGCTPVSEGCDNCYARRFAARLRSMGLPEYRDGFKLTLHEHRVELPMLWTKGRRCFVNSMGDLFHPDVPLEFLRRVFLTMNLASWHRFLVLTKRPEILVNVWRDLIWSPNVWMGVTVESAAHLDRIAQLVKVPAAVRWLSLEPLLGPLPELPLDGIDWVVVGGEKGPHARPMSPDWVRNVRDQVAAAGLPLCFKGWGGTKRSGRVLDGRTWDQYPPDLNSCRDVASRS